MSSENDDTDQFISPEAIREIEALFPHVPHRSATAIEAMKIVQKHNRWVSDDALKALAALLGMTYHELDSVATFYNMIFRRPVGRHVIFVCNSVSCWLMGYEHVRDQLIRRLGVDFGETTADDRFTLLPIPCLGTCDHAPAVLIDEDLYRDVKTDELDRILEKYT